MKGLVFNLGSKKKMIRIPRIKRPSLSLREIFSLYGIQAFFFAMFFMGLVVGAASSKAFDKELYNRLDFLFVTNIEARLSMSAFDIFISCFVSYFLFIFLLFLFGASVWGFAAVPALCVFKGFSVGLSSAYLFAAHSGAGIGFYIVVILPGTVGFIFTLIRYSRDCIRLSLVYAKMSLFGDRGNEDLRTHIKGFLKNSLYAFIFSGACAVADMLLWVLLADKFNLT